MDKSLAILTAANQELYRRAAGIPFMNSDFQNAVFIIEAEITPERKYRAALVNLMEKLEALNSAYFGLKRQEVEVARRQALIANPEADHFDKQIAELDLQQMELDRPRLEKLIADCQHEAQWYFDLARSYQELTRSQFEAGELGHFTLRYEMMDPNTPGLIEDKAKIGRYVQNLMLLEQSANKELSAGVTHEE